MSSCGCSSSSSLLLGHRPSVRFDITDVDGDPADPTAITIRVMSPSGTIVAYNQDHATVSNPAVGTWIWQAPDGIDEAGEWWVYAVAEGGGADVAAETSFVIGDIHVPLG